MAVSLKLSGCLPAEEIGDAIARHAKQPAGDMLDGHQQAVGFHQLVEYVLENVFGVARVGHPPANEVAQPRPAPLHHGGDSLVLFARRALQGPCVLHLVM